MTHGSLFSGIGGFDLASEWMGWENAFHCEKNPFCQRVLRYYWPKAKSYDDIKTTDFPKGGVNAKESVLQEAERIINGDRLEAYGDVKEGFENIAKGWSAIFGKEVSGKQVGLAMSWLKICRENNNHKRDNLVDLAGYAALIDKL